MRLHLLAAVALLAMPMVAGQPTETDFGETYLARVAEGDIPLVDAGEPQTGWNVAEYLRFQHDGNESRLALASDQGDVVDASCACGNITVQETALVVGSDVPAGKHLVRLVRHIPASNGVLVDLALYGGQDGRIVVYLPDGHHVDTSAPRQSGGLQCTGGRPCTIHEFTAEPGMHLAVLPGQADASTVPAPSAAERWLPLLAGLLAGMLFWALLVHRGLVQRRRRQEVAQAAHVTAAAEGKDMLQARKRVLMAALKDLEMAKMNKQVDDDSYGKLKAELKRQTVTVMRALEQNA